MEELRIRTEELNDYTKEDLVTRLENIAEETTKYNNIIYTTKTTAERKTNETYNELEEIKSLIKNDFLNENTIEKYPAFFRFEFK